MLTFPPDHTFFLEIILFVVLWFGLKRLLFDPMVQLLAERERRTTGAREEAHRIQATTEVSSAEYTTRMQEIRRTLLAEAQAAHEKTITEQQRILDDARQQAGTQLGQLRDNLTRLADGVRQALGAEARPLAASMLERVAGRRLE